LVNGSKTGYASDHEFYSYPGGCKVPDSPEFRYSPFTAADEKIPLSMVHVNYKPQHLVF